IGYRYIKRGSPIRIAFIHTPYLIQQICLNQSSEQFDIPFINIDSFEVPYIHREDLLQELDIHEDVEDKDEIYDFDLNLVNINIPYDLIEKIKIHNIDEIDNMIILDLRYLFSKINERIVHY